VRRGQNVTWAWPASRGGSAVPLVDVAEALVDVGQEI
jgi:hypothetical protein